ncbi:MAG: hypothetical protein AB1814_09590 [Thermodesulfobacteriota bacterium]
MPRRLINLGLSLLLLLPLWSAPRLAMAVEAPVCPMGRMAAGHHGGCCGPQAPCCLEQPSDGRQMSLGHCPRLLPPAMVGAVAAPALAQPQAAFLAPPQPRARAPVPLRLLLATYRI